MQRFNLDWNWRRKRERHFPAFFVDGPLGRTVLRFLWNAEWLRWKTGWHKMEFATLRISIGICMPRRPGLHFTKFPQPDKDHLCFYA